mgnify:CR=1 FL=1|tara:strand:+ start:3062 stop:3964 length:903 start_codon:yes stop_codon:yes gene_type:complete
MSFNFHPTTFLDAEISEFENVYSTIPLKTTTFRDWLFCRNKEWLDKLEKVKAAKSKEEIKKHKANLPCITGSGVFVDGKVDVNLEKHNGFILIDVDYKDNLHLKENFHELKANVFSKIKEVCYAGLSASGLGYYLIIRLENPKRHKEYFDFISIWLKDAEDINIDASCSNLNRLRFFSIDDDQYINEQASTLKESILGAKKNPTYVQVKGSNTDILALVEKIEASGVSIAPDYDSYFKLAVTFYNLLGEAGREYFHRTCCIDSAYDSKQSDDLFDDISKRGYTKCTLGTLIFLMKQSNVI